MQNEKGMVQYFMPNSTGGGSCRACIDRVITSKHVQHERPLFLTCSARTSPFLNWKALAFGLQKINLHEAGHEVDPKAHRPTPGSADLCFITQEPVSRIIEHFNRLGIEIIEGPVKRKGALGPIESVYLRDPDGNLIEISNYPDRAP
jgi:catechol 2,3-dioxygenase-like lactoylglutathione lyase family enzyme